MAELEKNINSVFELNEDGNLMKPPPVPAMKRGRSKPLKKKSMKRKQSIDSDEEYGDSGKENQTETPMRRSNRNRRKRVLEESDSD